MNTGIQNLIKALESELGYTEKSDGYSKFGDWYTKNVDDSYDFGHAAWCDTFLAWGAQQAGVTAQTGQFAYTPSHAAWFKKQDAWGTKPEPGAFVFYDWSGGKGIDGVDHVGIVTSVEGSTIHTIEGNVDGQFAKRKDRDQGNVVGYGYPEKVKVAPAQPQAPAPQQKAALPSAGGSGGGTATVLAQQASAPQDAPSVELWGAFTAIILAAIAVLIVARRTVLPNARRATARKGRHHRSATTA
ncbi:CHAP domain-containing protein [Actinomadura barringtoniae]|uniref:CHAP domain-containing protein n=1 Tax=Actinomadura barringtoniae TaxID=1427535 RepID=UPI001FB60DF2|nr:CHAP domain-containing protein [Actinomadura barringtoniae]